MKIFDYVRASTVEEAVAAAAQAGSAYLAAGTNVLDLMKGGAMRPDRPSSTSRACRASDRLERLADGGVRIAGAGAERQTSHDADFARAYPAVAEALLRRLGAAPQRRNRWRQT
jgi:xanthine dehydrogenase YagS FAD-binding subunit